MEAAVVSVGQAALNCLLSGAKYAIAEDTALTQSVQRDVVFLTDELAAMKSFLRDADEERNRHKVPRSRVSQVRDLAYDIDDCLQEHAVHLEKPSGWRLARAVLERHRIAEEMKGLRARAEDMNLRNMRYHLGEDAGGCSGAESSSIVPLGTGAKRQGDLFFESGQVDLVPLISRDDQQLRVIAVWGDPWKTTIVRKAYDDLKMKETQCQEKNDLKKKETQCQEEDDLKKETQCQEEDDLKKETQCQEENDLKKKETQSQEENDLKKKETQCQKENDLKKNKFECHAWVRIRHPFDPSEFLRCIVRQFYVNSLREAAGNTQEEATLGTRVQNRMEAMSQADLVREFNKHVTQKSYLIVLNDLSTIEDWDWIKTYFPNNEKGSRIIVSTERGEVATLCAGPERLVLELKQTSTDQIIYAFCEKDTTELEHCSTSTTTSSNNSAGRKRLTRIKTMENSPQESQFIRRQNEISYITSMLISSNDDEKELRVIIIFGKGGLGKTTLVKSVYQSEDLRSEFHKRAYVTIKHPFIRKDLISSLVEQLRDNKEGVGCGDRTKSGDGQVLTRLLKGKKYLIVLDGLPSAKEWDDISKFFPDESVASRIMLTTSIENMAKHCSNNKEDNICRLETLKEKDANNLFIEKVFGRIINLDENYPELAREAKSILNKCDGFPLAILTVGGVLKKRPKTPVEWRKLNEYIDPDTGTNPECEAIRIILAKCYDCLPYDLKSCFLYLSIFPEDHNISRRRLVHRWTAEGYSRDEHGKYAKEIADGYFMELIDRNMILPFIESVGSTKGIDSCKFNDLVHELSTLMSAEENFVFRLEEGCGMNTPIKIRHLSVSDNWNGGRSEFENIVNPSSIRSLTVFGKWRPFLISERMRMLRVLDLEGTLGLNDHHLEHIGKLVHLKYLSLRHCHHIYYLPHSLGNLRQLETLDIKHTAIIKLPRAIIRLRKLQYLRAGGIVVFDGQSYEEIVEDLFPSKLLKNRLCILSLFSAILCVASCAPQMIIDGHPNRHDVCTAWCCTMFPFMARRLDTRGVLLPSGVNKLNALRTLGTVNIGGGRGKAVLQDIRGLTRLRKLGVAGVTQKNCQDLDLALSALSNLESLSVRLVKEPGLQNICEPNGSSCSTPENILSLSPPESLKSLKLYGSLCKLPQWINGLRNLMKLSLRYSSISDHAAAMEVLGRLPKLSILRIREKSFRGEDLCFIFDHQTFPSLKVLVLVLISGLKLVEFKEGATPKLELLQFCGFPNKTESGFFRGLASLPRLKEFVLDNDTYKEEFLKDLKDQLAGNSNGPILKRD